MYKFNLFSPASTDIADNTKLPRNLVILSLYFLLFSLLFLPKYVFHSYYVFSFITAKSFVYFSNGNIFDLLFLCLNIPWYGSMDKLFLFQILCPHYMEYIFFVCYTVIDSASDTTNQFLSRVLGIYNVH